jgi:CBS domain-containing protein
MPVAVRDVMTRSVVSVRPDASIAEAAQKMVAHQISGLPVIDEAGKLVGIVTDRDLLRREKGQSRSERPRWLDFLIGPEPPQRAFMPFHERRVSEVMTAEPLTVAEDAPLQAAVRLMEQHQLKRLPVMRGDRIVGIIARGDLIRALAMKIIKVQATNNAVQRDRLLELERQAWMHRIR